MPIEWDGRQIPRTMLYDVGAKLSLENAIPVLIHTGMDVSDANLAHYLATGKLTIEARDYLASMRGKLQASIQAIAKATKNIPLSG